MTVGASRRMVTTRDRNQQRVFICGHPEVDCLQSNEVGVCPDKPKTRYHTQKGLHHAKNLASSVPCGDNRGRSGRIGRTVRLCRSAALRPHQRDLPATGWIDDDDFNPAYLKRAVPLLPRRLDDPEWRHTQDYWREKDEFPAIDLEDEIFAYDRLAAPTGGSEPALAAD